MLKRKLILICIPTLIIVWTQGCSRVSFLDTNPILGKDNLGADNSGNGGTYDGKLRVVHHYVDGFQCEGMSQPESILIRKDSSSGWVMIQNTKDKCAVIDQQPVTGVAYDDSIKQAKFNGVTYVAPKPYVVDPNEDPNLPDVKPLDGVCEDINGKCSLLAALQSTEVASYTTAVNVTIPDADYKISQELALTSGPNGNPISVSGASSANTVLDGQGKTSIMRLYGVASSGPVSLQNLKFSAGFVPYTFGTGTQTTASALENNLPVALQMTNLIFENNSGADIFRTTAGGGDTTFLQSKFSNNSPKLWLVKLDTVPNGHLTLDKVDMNNTIVGVAGGAVDITNSGGLGTALTVRNSSITNTRGGAALYLDYITEALIENTTLANNDQQAVDIITGGNAQQRNITILNSTIYNNGYLTAWGQSNVYMSVNDAPQRLIMKNSVVAITDTSKASNCLNYSSVVGASLVTATNSLFDDNSCYAQGTGNTVGPAQLMPILNSGYFFLQLVPVPGSGLIDTGDNASCLATDQLGQPRPVDKTGGGPRCDIGAIEVQ